MSISITKAAFLANQAVNKSPNLVLKIEGYDTLLSAAIIRKNALYGDDIYYGDDDLFYGGSIPIKDQENFISFQAGTTTSFGQQINIETGVGSSVLNYQVALIDKDGKMTDLISPGIEIDDILGTPVELFYGFASTVFPDDYVRLFKGTVNNVDSGSGVVKLGIIASQKKQLATLFVKTESVLDGAITNAQTTIPVDDGSQFKVATVGPDGVTFDDDLTFMVRIDDEIIEYTGVSGNSLTGCLRGRLGTLANPHDDTKNVESYYHLQGDAMELTLKFMMSGRGSAYISDLQIEDFTADDDAIFFKDQNLKDSYNITVGDFITITGSTNPANNLDKEPITRFEVRDDGFGFNIYTAAGLVNEYDSAAVASISSQWDVWQDGLGLKMVPDEVDIDQHIELKNSYLAGVVYEFYIDQDIESGKEFIDNQLYNPVSAFGLTRGTRASVGVQSPPLPNESIKILNADNVNNADKLKIQRTSGKNFFNGAVYKINAKALETDKFAKTEAVLSGESFTRFGENIPDSFLSIEAKGFREENGARPFAQSLGNRRLSIYEFGAEFLKGVSVNLNPGLTIEPGDVVLLDFASLQISDKETASRRGEPRLFRVDGRKFDIAKGTVQLDMIDTQFNKDARFALVSASSILQTGNSSTEFVIEPSFSKPFGDDEFRKWTSYIGINVVVRDFNFTQVSPPVRLEKITGNTITVADLGFTPSAGMVMEFAPYSQLGLESIADTVKLLFASSTDDLNDFADGKPAYQIS